MGAVAIDAAADGDADATVRNRCRFVIGLTFGIGDDTSGKLLRGRDGSVDFQVPDVGSTDVAEGGGVLLVGGVVDGQRMAVAVEVALEAVEAAAHHRRHADVVAKLVIGCGIVAGGIVAVSIDVD